MKLWILQVMWFQDAGKFQLQKLEMIILNDLTKILKDKQWAFSPTVDGNAKSLDMCFLHWSEMTSLFTDVECDLMQIIALLGEVL